MPEKIPVRTQISKAYYSDLEKDGMLYARLVRSPKKSGVLKNIECKDLPENFFLITAKNFPGVNSVETLGLATEIFAAEKIQYEGQPLAILAGPDKEAVNELAAKVKVEIESAGGAAEKGILSQKHIVLGGGKDKSVAKLFTKAAARVSGKWSYKLSSTEVNETNGALCYFVKDNLVINTPTLWPRHLIKSVAAVFSIPEENIIISKTVSSEPNTNAIWQNTILVCQICAAVIASRKPVKMQLSREENEKYFSCKGEVIITHKTALDKEGLIKAATIDIDFDAGAFNPFADEIIERLTIASTGVYNFSNLEINAAAHSSAKPPSTINVETIDAQSFFALECQLQKICMVTGIEPDTLRFKNSKILNTANADNAAAATPRGKMPFSITVEKAGDALGAILRQSDFKRKFVSYRINSESQHKEANDYRPYNINPRGIGLSTAYDASGYYGTNIFECDQKMEATLQKDGSLIIHAVTPSKTVLEIWKNAAAEILQIEPKMVKVNSEFNLKEEPVIPENFYSNISIMTSLLKKCCQGIQTKRFRSPLPITVSKGITKSQINQWNKARFRGVPFNSTSFAVVALELNVDPSTFRPKIKNIWVAVSAGKILAGKEAEAKIKFSIEKTLAELIEGERLCAKKISIAFVQSEAESAQIGGLIKKSLPAAFASALSQALGTSVQSVPLKVDGVYNLVKKKEDEAQ